MNEVSFHDLSLSSDVPPALLKRATTDLTSFYERAQPLIDAVKREGDEALEKCAER